MRAALLVVRRILVTAVAGGAIRSNAADGVRKPRSDRQEMHFLTPEQVTLLADEISKPPVTVPRGRDRRHEYLTYGLLVRFAAYTGLRAGEIGALRVGRLDLMGGRVEVAESLADVRGRLVFGQPKTYQRRTVPIPKSLTDELTPLVGGKRRNDLVFTASDGGPLRHGNFYRRYFKPAVTRAGVPEDLRFHDLRHTYAALLIAQGAHPRAMMERLGHSSVTVTLNTYGHLVPGLEERLTEALDDTYRAAARPVRDTENPTIVAMTPSRSGTDLARRRSRPRRRTAK